MYNLSLALIISEVKYKKVTKFIKVTYNIQAQLIR